MRPWSPVCSQPSVDGFGRLSGAFVIALHRVWRAGQDFLRFAVDPARCRTGRGRRSPVCLSGCIMWLLAPFSVMPYASERGRPRWPNKSLVAVGIGGGPETLGRLLSSPSPLGSYVSPARKPRVSSATGPVFSSGILERTPRRSFVQMRGTAKKKVGRTSLGWPRSGRCSR